ncbi:MAG: hemolysin III family protein [Sphaerochaetaceae bacterium]|nr:hemolysin III family protein [Sphaerochaetaceae bacterium]MDC7242949.1 hemolysin III family protein [Sphaerochaetaceae bacterium]MDC7248802.1 hemolysin III family protein [Sphaerochaetaceae bacterium]
MISKKERMNSLSHGIGVIFGIAALVVLESRSKNSNERLAFLIYGISQIILYLTSTATHLLTGKPKIHAVVRVLDQSAVYLLIAGTYTPIAMLVLPNPYKWQLLSLIWAMAGAGIIMKSVFLAKEHLLSDLLYLPMGWMVLLFLNPLQKFSPKGLLFWIFAGGITYSGGIIFYAVKKIEYHHLIWHLFVLGGSACFFIGFLRHLV